MKTPLFAVVVALASTTASAFGQVDPYRFVAFPDTQYYTTTPELHQILLAQVDWLRSHAVSDRLVFLSHVGDVVHSGAAGPNGNNVEWRRGMNALNRLEGGIPNEQRAPIPYSVAIGNRDYDVVSDKQGGVTRFVEFLGHERYVDEPWYLGSSRNDLLHAQRFPSPAGDWLHVALDWKPDDATLLFAQGMIDANPGIPVIITVHEFLSQGVDAPWRLDGATPNDSGENNPEQVYRKLIEPNPAIVLVFCGHISGGGYRTDHTIFGHDVHQLLSDFQNDPQGGNGWLVTAEIVEATSKIHFATTSPTYIPGVTTGPDRSIDPQTNFDRDYDSIAHRQELSRTRTLHFRDGLEVSPGTIWDGTVDTFLEGGSMVRRDSDPDVLARGGTLRRQGLLAFEGLIGTGSAQVPPNATIRRAVLTLTTEGAGAESLAGAQLHRMTVPWSGADTWTSLDQGIQVGMECEATADVITQGEISSKGTRSFDVTASVQAWVTGSANHGWVILSGGNDTWSFRSSDWYGIMERPQLTVQFEADCHPPAPFCVAEFNSTGTTGDLDFVGSQSQTSLDLSFRASDLPAGSTTILIGGLSRDARAVGDGRICVGGPSLVRLGVPVTTNALGSVHLTVPPAAAASLAALSERWQFQAWHRDSTSAGSNLTGALDVQLCD